MGLAPSNESKLGDFALADAACEPRKPARSPVCGTCIWSGGELGEPVDSELIPTRISFASSSSNSSPYPSEELALLEQELRSVQSSRGESSEAVLLLARVALMRAEAGNTAGALDAYNQALRLRVLKGTLKSTDGVQLLLDTGVVRSQCGDLEGARECYELLRELREHGPMAGMVPRQLPGKNRRRPFGSMELLDLLRGIGLGMDGFAADGDISPCSHSSQDRKHWMSSNSLRDVWFLANLGVLKAALGDFDDSLDALLESCRISEHLGQAPAQGLAKKLEESLLHVGMELRKQRSLDGAMKAFLAARKLRAETQSPETPRAAALNMRLGVVYHMRGDLAKALEAYSEARTTCTRLGKLESKDGVQLCQNIGLAKHALDDFKGALEAYSEAWALHEQMRTPALDVSEAITLMINIAKARAELGELKGASEAFRGALSLCQSTGSLMTPIGAQLLTEIGHAKLKVEDPAGAVEAYCEARRIRESIGTLETLAGAELCHSLGNARRVGGDLDEALEAYDESCRIVRRTGVTETSRSAIMLSCLAQTRHLLGHLDEALSAYAEEFQIRQQTGTVDTLEGARMLRNMGSTIHGIGDVEGALQAYDMARRIHELTGTNDSHDCQQLLHVIEVIRIKCGDPRGSGRSVRPGPDKSSIKLEEGSVLLGRIKQAQRFRALERACEAYIDGHNLAALVQD